MAKSLDDIYEELEQIEFKLSLIEDNIRLAKAHIGQTEGITYLNNAQKRIKKIDFKSMIKSVERIIK